MSTNNEELERQKNDARRKIKSIIADVEKIRKMLAQTDALNEAAYLRRAITELTKAARTL